MKSYEIAVIPGDGIGKETSVEALKVLAAAQDTFGFKLKTHDFDWSCETYKATGQMMPDDGLDRLRDHDAILLGAVGYPGVPDHISLWGLLLPIRQRFDQYVNLRPVRLLPGIQAPVRHENIDFWVVRENTEGEYSNLGGRFKPGSADEFVLQQSIFSRKGVDRILKYAFDFAETLGRPHVTSATKSNGLFHSMPYWDERFAEMATAYPGVRTDQYHIDILAARFVMSPQQFDVVVGSNLFGDILSDLGPGMTGTIALAPSANINPEHTYPSMFEPVHGSAPDIAGQGIANPIGHIWCAAMMLQHLGEQAAGDAMIRAIEETLAETNAAKTPDLGGTAKTPELGDAITAAFRRITA